MKHSERLGLISGKREDTVVTLIYVPPILPCSILDDFHISDSAGSTWKSRLSRLPLMT